MATMTKTKVKRAVRINKRRASGQCCCWDCLRSVGLTPPLGARHQHPQIQPSREVGWVEGFELRGEDREIFRAMRRQRHEDKGGTGKVLMLAEHKAADHLINKTYDLMKQVRMV